MCERGVKCMYVYINENELWMLCRNQPAIQKEVLFANLKKSGQKMFGRFERNSLNCNPNAPYENTLFPLYGKCSVRSFYPNTEVLYLQGKLGEFKEI